MRRSVLLMMVVIGGLSTWQGEARAESEAACSIWLCLPGGFPSGCVAAYNEFKNRLEHGKPPLPDLGSCTTGSDGKATSGSYQMGVEEFAPCKKGFVLEERSQGQGFCMPTSYQCSGSEKYRQEKKVDCTPYLATKRAKSRFIKMWVGGEYLGQFFY